MDKNPALHELRYLQQCFCQEINERTVEFYEAKFNLVWYC